MKNLKKLRETAGLTQKQLAERLGIARATVARWELEEDRYPAGVVISKVAKVLACKEGDFF